MIKFLDLQRLNAPYAQALREAAGHAIDSGWYLLGENVRRFERELQHFQGGGHVVAVGNGLDALRLILRGYMELGMLQPDDEVLLPANTYIASVLAVTDCGLRPVLVEPDAHTYNMDLQLLERHRTPRTRAVMLVHLYGRACWSGGLEAWARQYGLLLLEDNAQAIGACWRGRRTGSLGDAAAFSFYPGKNLGALGDAGAVCTSHAALAEVVRALANYGSVQKYVNRYQGLNSRMDELQAAFLSVKLPFLPQENVRRAQIATRYLQGIRHAEVLLPDAAGEGEHVWHQFVLRTPRRDALQAHLQARGIETLIHYPIPPHRQQCYAGRWPAHAFPLTDRLSAQVLSLPIGPYLLEEEIAAVIEAVNGGW